MVNHDFCTVLSKKYANLCEFARNRRFFCTGHIDGHTNVTHSNTVQAYGYERSRLQKMAQPCHRPLKMKSMIWKVPHKLKIPKIETWSDGAAHQRKSTEAPSTLPGFAGNDCLENLPCVELIPQNVFLQKRSVWLVGDQLQRCSFVKMPEFSGLDHMPAGQMISIQQIKNAGQCRTLILQRGQRCWRRKGTPIPTPFRVGLKIKLADDFLH